MLTLKKVFKVSGNKFFTLFNEAGNNLVEMSSVFVSIIHEENVTFRDTMLSSLKELESKNEVIAHKMFIELGKNFITPFDREDIHALISSLDDIADFMYATARQIQSYKMVTIPHSTKNVANNLHKLTKQISDALTQLQDKRHLEALYPLCMEIKKTADLCTSLTDAGITRVYSDSNDPIEAVKRLDHYELIHTILDRCYGVVNALETIVIKYS